MGAILLLALAAADASQVMAQQGNRVVEVQVLGAADARVDTRTTIGSGFWIDERVLVTNFHVVSGLVWWPKTHRVQVTSGGRKLKGTVVEVDPPHDLALITVEEPSPTPLALAREEPARGATLFALGHPHDIGLSIVEGTFNGHAEGELEDLLHFSGSLNPGMSGGPCLSAAGEVVGVNVATRGNQVSFLVPGKWVRALVEQLKSGAHTNDLLAQVNRTVLESQDALTHELLAEPMTTTSLGAWQLPAAWPAKTLRPWGGPLNENDPNDLFAVTGYQLVGSAMTTLRSGAESTGAVALRHRLYEAKGIGSVQLYRRAGTYFVRDEGDLPGSGEEFHTRWSCDAHVFRQGGARLKSHLCMRAYKKIDGLYDVILRVMTFDEARATVVAELQLFGFTPQNAQRLGEPFLEAIRWKR